VDRRTDMKKLKGAFRDYAKGLKNAKKKKDLFLFTAG